MRDAKIPFVLVGLMLFRWTLFWFILHNCFFFFSNSHRTWVCRWMGINDCCRNSFRTKVNEISNIHISNVWSLSLYKTGYQLRLNQERTSRRTIRANDLFIIPFNEPIGRLCTTKRSQTSNLAIWILICVVWCVSGIVARCPCLEFAKHLQENVISNWNINQIK